MTKKLDTDQITNELKGQSLYFEDQGKRIAKKSEVKPANMRTDERTNERTGEQANARTDERTGERTSEQVNARTTEQPNEGTHEQITVENRQQKTTKRTITRHSYQFYADQVAEMKQLWLSYQAQGLDIDLSDLARDAFDDYLACIRENANERTNERTDERSNTRTYEREKERLDKEN